MTPTRYIRRLGERAEETNGAMADGVPIPVAEGGEAHGGRHKCDSQGEGGVSTQEEGEHTGHTHGEKLTKERTHTVKSMRRSQGGLGVGPDEEHTAHGKEGRKERGRREYLHELPDGSDVVAWGEEQSRR